MGGGGGGKGEAEQGSWAGEGDGEGGALSGWGGVGMLRGLVACAY